MSVRYANRVTFVIGSLECGGAERTVVNLSAALIRTGRDVTVITVAEPESDFFELDPGVRRICIGRRRSRGGALAYVTRKLKGLKKLRAALNDSQPDVVVSFLDAMNVATLIAAAGLGLAIVVAERNDPAHHDAGLICGILRRHLYSRAAALVVQTRAVAAWGARVVSPDRVRIIPNAVIPRALDPDPVEIPETGPLLIAVGRLDAQKGFDLLLEAFSRSSATRPGWRLLILGEGPQRAALERQVARLGLSARVRFPGIVADVSPYLARADAFVLSSRYEGFPNVLLEAMAVGRAVVAFACGSGPAEIVRHEHDGLLVRAASVVELTAALARVMGDSALRERLGGAARRSVRRFDMRYVLPLWEGLLEEAALGAVARAPRDHMFYSLSFPGTAAEEGGGSAKCYRRENQGQPPG